MWLHHCIQNVNTIKFDRRHAQIGFHGEEIQAREVETKDLYKGRPHKSGFVQSISKEYADCTSAYSSSRQVNSIFYFQHLDSRRERYWQIKIKGKSIKVDTSHPSQAHTSSAKRQVPNISLHARKAFSGLCLLFEVGPASSNRRFWCNKP